jgi:hypothetical protein
MRTRQTTGSARVGLGLAAGGTLLALGLLAVLYFGGDAPSAETRQAEATRCQDAVQAVQQYTAPGQTFDVLTNVQLGLLAERRPVQVEGWATPRAGADFCLVFFHATIGNDPQTYTWLYDLRTHHVEARDDATRRLSGW